MGGSADLSMDIDDVGWGEFDDGTESIAVVTAESFYADNGQSVCALVILCHGLLHDDGTPAVDVANLPWSQMKRYAIRPKADELKAEIIRCWNVICAGTPPALNQAPTATPRPKQWSLSKVQKWLEENPIGTGFGREFSLLQLMRGSSLRRKQRKRRKKNHLFSTRDGLAKNPFSG